METAGSLFSTIFSDENKERLGVHYLGTSLLIAWYYGLWFSPNIFTSVPIIDNMVTYSWLCTLAISGLSFLALSYFFRGERHVRNHPALMMAAAIVASLSTFAFAAWDATLSIPLLALAVFPLMFGITNGIMLIGWGEYHGRRKSTFSVHKFSGAFGAVIFGSIIVATALPHVFANFFIALLPIISALTYMKANGHLGDAPFPTLLPKATRAKAMRATIVISLTIFIACMACYFNIAIVPTDVLNDGGGLYVVGIAVSGIAATFIALLQSAVIKSGGAYRFIPWLFAATSVAIALFVSGDARAYPASFTITVALAGIFEMILIAYFGTISSKGQIATAVAFGISGAVVRLGFFAGDAWAVFYEHQPQIAQTFVIPTSLLLLCLLSVCLIPLLRQEYTILKLTTASPRTNETDEVCDAAIAEFSLSKREGEILKLIARGYNIDTISKKLVISPYTTQTHVRHIYSKMHIHKRSELLDYINMHRGD